MIRRLLVANRGEIARRIFRTCRGLGIETVAVHSDADTGEPFVVEADRAVRLPGVTPGDTYLRIDLLVAAAAHSGADSVHPGYGFLAENASFAQAVLDAGLCWVGPSPTTISAMGSKIEAKRLMRVHGVPVAPDSTIESLAEIGLPALVKAAYGGGGRGMRLVRSASELDDAIATAQREATSSFGDGTVFVERYIDGARHVEVQIFGDTHGNVVALHERDCTLQRRHQKVVEEAPSPAVDGPLRERLSAAAVTAAGAVGYVGAGTVEFLLDADRNFWFLEMNTRLQVEHPVTEMVTGIDLVALQIAVAEGRPLPDSVRAGVPLRGHAVEVRLCAEDPATGFLPSTGVFHRVRFPAVDGLRVDSAVESGSTVTPHYDSMIAKLIVHADTRDEAVRKAQAALRGAELHGPVTNRELLVDVLSWPPDDTDTGLLDRCTFTAPATDIADVAAAAMAVVDSRNVTARFPVGWRNNPSQLHHQAVGDHIVAYRFDRANRLVELHVDDHPATTDPGEIAARRAVVYGDTVYVRGGAARFDIPPRFAPPDDAGRAGSTVAPMPGKVVAVLVAVGDTVVPGQPLLTIEAMKMEHQVVAPHAGTVTDVFVARGQQLDRGQPLLKVDGP